MIVFCSNKELIPHLYARYNNRQVKIFNLSSYYSGYIDVSNLMHFMKPNTPMIDFVNEVEFDIEYASYIFNDSNNFISFMKIMSSSFEGDICIVMVYREPYRDAVMESLIKLIQQRYAYNCWIIEALEDIDLLNDNGYDTIGLMNLFQDIQRYDQYYNTDQRISVE